MAWGYGVPCPKPTPRIVERKAKRAASAKIAAEAKTAVWTHAKNRCERCGKPLMRDVVSFSMVGHVHHVKKRSQGGTWDAKNLRLLCERCHRDEHSGGRTR